MPNNSAPAANTALATLDPGTYTALRLSPKRIHDTLAATLSGGVKWTDLDRAKAKGDSGWELATTEGKQKYPTIEGIVIGVFDYRQYWEAAYDAAGPKSPPDCSSNDMLFGHGRYEGMPCARCPMNQFTVKANGKPGAKPCAERKRVFLLRGDSLLPIVLDVPPASLKYVKKYFFGLGAKGILPWGVITRFQMETGANDAFAHIQPIQVLVLSDDQAEHIGGLHDALLPIMESADAGLAPDNGNGNGDDDEYPKSVVLSNGQVVAQADAAADPTGDLPF